MLLSRVYLSVAAALIRWEKYEEIQYKADDTEKKYLSRRPLICLKGIHSCIAISEQLLVFSGLWNYFRKRCGVDILYFCHFDA